MKFSTLELTVDLLVEIDRLVQMIESPIFTFLRLQLLEEDGYPHLIKSLYGILMLLPQGTAFNTLKNRLDCIPDATNSDINKLLCIVSTQNSDKEVVKIRNKLLKDILHRSSQALTKEANESSGLDIDFAELSFHFDEVALRHASARREARNKRRLKV